jgi:deoxyribodipyrimidine photo-lyase
MKKEFSKSLFIFRRDLRLHDNLGLLSALERSEQVYPVFIFDPRQVSDNQYASTKAIAFMINSLSELRESIESGGGSFSYRYGQAESELSTLLQQEGFEAVFCNADYTPFARQRDEELRNVTNKAGAEFILVHDALLTEPGSVLKADGTPYTVYTFFMKKAREQQVAKPRVNRFENFARSAPKGAWPLDASKLIGTEDHSQLFCKGGRKEAVLILRDLERYHDYHEQRNFPAKGATSGLSAHHKFGTISVRETYHAVAAKLGADHTLINELYWRDFFYHILWHFPRVLGSAFLEKFRNLKWRNAESDFERWCQGLTGFPIVDAGMRELVATGFMHNRVRMITASFLVKDLQIDWQRGEKFFAQHLIDYDPAVNNGNWQWAASTGCDAQPYFRIFNPWTQQKKFDADAVYIKRWVPELASLSAREIHALETKDKARPLAYPAPMVDHSEARVLTKQLYEVD